MFETKKQNVSVRMNTSDLQQLKEIAQRLRVRESEVFRFAVRSTLRKLLPLNDISVRGRDLLPVLIEFGSELVSFFGMDQRQFNEIINDGVAEELKVEKEDIELLSMCANREQYVYLKLKHVVNTRLPPMGAIALVKQYLMEKYANPSVASAPFDTCIKET